MGRWLPAIDNDGKISAFQVFFRANWNFGMNVWFFFLFLFLDRLYRLRKLCKIGLYQDLYSMFQKLF